ncbi:hypothetical protein ACPPVO_47110 [Dactylosporangium sp. McL0621]|uniref:hypothetical protein n=1 Tax=Dactylosporangium sp. McL0621 TaxID=3415678 RepID=UPI003CF5BE47
MITNPEPIIGFVHYLGEQLLNTYNHADWATRHLGRNLSATEVLDALLDDTTELLRPVWTRIELVIVTGTPTDALAELFKGLTGLYDVVLHLSHRPDTADDGRLLHRVLADVFDASVTCLIWGDGR